MTPQAHQGGWIIIATFVAALMLTVAPLPDWLGQMRPEWAALVLIYWCMALPQRIGVGVGWIVGLFVDVLRAELLGQYALAFALIAYVTLHLHRRVRVFPLWQQAASILVLIVLEQMLILWVKGIMGQSPHTWTYWLPSVTSMLVWPIVYILLRGIRRYYRIS